jgi:hypothetical protein
MSQNNASRLGASKARSAFGLMLLVLSLAVIAMPDPRPWWSQLALLPAALPYSYLLLRDKGLGLWRLKINKELLSANLMLPAFETIVAIAFVIALVLTPLPSPP